MDVKKFLIWFESDEYNMIVFDTDNLTHNMLPKTIDFNLKGNRVCGGGQMLIDDLKKQIKFFNNSVKYGFPMIIDLENVIKNCNYLQNYKEYTFLSFADANYPYLHLTPTILNI